MPVPVDLTNYKSISVEPLDGIKKVQAIVKAECWWLTVANKMDPINKLGSD